VLQRDGLNVELLLLMSVIFSSDSLRLSLWQSLLQHKIFSQSK